MTSEPEVLRFLKDNLHLIEPGLVLVSTNAHVRDPAGSDGYIDILARDARGYHVIIELKRNRNAAREGLQELAKYTRLLAENAGLPQTRMRAIIVSSDWHELHAAFAELKAIFPVRLEGYRYSIGPDSVPCNFEPILPRPPTDPMSLSPRHFVLVCQTEPDAEEELRRINTKLSAVGVADYVVFVFDRLMDYVLYCVIQHVTPALFDRVAAATDTGVESDGTPTKFGNWEYAVFFLIAEGHTRDEVDNAFAPVLANFVLKYPLCEVRKYGRFEHAFDAWSDKDLVLEAIRCAYADEATDQPAPQHLLEAVYRHHMWDIDL